MNIDNINLKSALLMAVSVGITALTEFIIIRSGNILYFMIPFFINVLYWNIVMIDKNKNRINTMVLLSTILFMIPSLSLMMSMAHGILPNIKMYVLLFSIYLLLSFSCIISVLASFIIGKIIDYIQWQLIQGK